MHRAMTRLAQTMAVLGALVLSFLVVMTCISVIGRELNSFLNGDLMMTLAPGFAQALLDLGVGPVLGDFELIENGMPFAIFAFLPLAQIGAAHATVDIFTSRFPPGLLRVMRAITEIVFAIVLIVFTVKLYEGMQGKIRYGETTYLIQFPVWWAFAAAVAASAVAALVAVYVALLRIVEVAAGREIAPRGPEAGH